MNFKVGDKIKYKGRVGYIMQAWWDGDDYRYEVNCPKFWGLWSVTETSLVTQGNKGADHGTLDDTGKVRNSRVHKPS